MGQIVREAAREWLRTMLEQGVAPVETGMAKAALVPVGRILRNVGGLGISPTRKPYFSKLEGGTQDIGFGESKTSVTIRDDKSNPLTFVYEFEWTTEVLHYWLRQYYNGPAIPGEDALPQAEDAFLQHVNATLARRLPHFADFILPVR